MCVQARPKGKAVLPEPDGGMRWRGVGDDNREALHLKANRTYMRVEWKRCAFRSDAGGIVQPVDGNSHILEHSEYINNLIILLTGRMCRCDVAKMKKYQ